ncbi:MFS transporter [Sediminicoccus sp. KRV36]|uniref:MFS transporter n=1 Tax=Sediminicoccus sp. KRV36 TaxID=3133721 RepID=UPI00200DBA46|nr:MFS transporter [Sediminicoccus rosea]UPY36146.1 MFS transporter [Sediminicoccus rosea]
MAKPGIPQDQARRIILARGLRDFGDGFIAVLLPVYLATFGFSAAMIGLAATLALLGSAAMTLAMGLWGGGVAPRALLLGCAALMALTGAAFAVTGEPALLLLAAALGTANPSAGSASIFAPVEQSALSGHVAARDRTAMFARYSFVGAMAAAVGALASASPELLEHLGLTPLGALRAMFWLYAALGLAIAAIYAGLVEAGPPPSREAGRLGPSRGIVTRLALLFSVDAFAGGFAVQSLMALWLFERFGMSLATAALFFFWAGVLGAFSLPLAGWLGARIGLVNTMVFSHIPASLCLMAAALVPDLGWALGLLLLRAALSQMDVPARASYVMAVVTPAERVAAASFTAVPRSLAAAGGPVLAGMLFSAGLSAWPFLICGGLKIAYDLALLAMFRRIRPEEEA